VHPILHPPRHAMAVGDTSTSPESPSKKRKVKTNPRKPWAKCDKPYFKDWRRDDFLFEFGMKEVEWEFFDVQV
jgi:hypothetical protein